MHIKGQNAGAWYGQISESRRATTEEALAVRRVPLAAAARATPCGASDFPFLHLQLRNGRQVYHTSVVVAAYW